MVQSGVSETVKRVFLIGYMGAGKTTLGKVLAKQLGMLFIDLDAYIESRYCKTIADLFAEKGEEAFRQIERQMLREVGEFEQVLVSTGGGTPCFFDNMEYINQQGVSVFLRVSVEELVSRLMVSRKKRPLIANKTDEELHALIAEGLSKRLPFYEQALISFDAEVMETKRDVKELAEELQACLCSKP